MHLIEPFFRWQGDYVASEDPRSPFYGRVYSEFHFENRIYNYLIHPQWDEFGSSTLYIKLLFVDYEQGSAIIECLGEWNDAIENDIMVLKSNVINALIEQGVKYFVLVFENVLNFHSSDKEYYQEWYDDVSEENGWIVALNMPQQTQQDFRQKKLHYYIELMEIDNWRNFKPGHLFEKINFELSNRLTL